MKYTWGGHVSEFDPEDNCWFWKQKYFAIGFTDARQNVMPSITKPCFELLKLRYDGLKYTRIFIWNILIDFGEEGWWDYYFLREED